jgi:hypothetical protein
VHTIDPHLLRIAYHLIHALGMAVLLGGAVVVAAACRGTDPTAARTVATAYERLFWPVVAIQVLTGIGNVGMLGDQVPEPGSTWGGWLTLKLLLVASLLVASLARTGVVAGHLARPASATTHRSARVLMGLHGATAGLLAAIAALGVRLGHG